MMRIALFFAASLFAMPAVAATVTVDNPWVPPSLSQPNAVGFMTLTSDEDDALVAAQSDCCAAVELHTHRMEGDVIRMRKVEQINLPAGIPTALRPGSYHIMLIGLKETLTDGMEVPVTLIFAHASPQTVPMKVDRAHLLEQIKSPKH